MKVKTNMLAVEVVESVEKAPKYDPPEYSLVNVEKCIIVPGGTESGKPTVDIQLIDESGQKYVTMLNGSVLEALGKTIETVRLMGE